jgi:hypothetical protein
MKEQARLREEMAYQYKLGNHQVCLSVCLSEFDAVTVRWGNARKFNKPFPYQAAAAIQKRLDPDAPLQ